MIKDVRFTCGPWLVVFPLFLLSALGGDVVSYLKKARIAVTVVGFSFVCVIYDPANFLDALRIKYFAIYLRVAQAREQVVTVVGEDVVISSTSMRVLAAAGVSNSVSTRKNGSLPAGVASQFPALAG